MPTRSSNRSVAAEVVCTSAAEPKCLAACSDLDDEQFLVAFAMVVTSHTGGVLEYR